MRQKRRRGEEGNRETILGFLYGAQTRLRKGKHTFARPYRWIDAQQGAKREAQSVWEGNERKGEERGRDTRRSRWRNESVDYGLWPSLCVCVGLSARFSHTVKTAHSQCGYACDCVCISHKVCSNWETAALTLTVGLHAKITHTHTPVKTQSVSPRCLPSLPLVGTLIRGEHQKDRKRVGSERDFFERQIFSVTPEFCFWLLCFGSKRRLAELRESEQEGGGSEETARWMKGDSEVSIQELRWRKRVTRPLLHSVSPSLILPSNLHNSTVLTPTQVAHRQRRLLWMPASVGRLNISITAEFTVCLITVTTSAFSSLGDCGFAPKIT